MMNNNNGNHPPLEAQSLEELRQEVRDRRVDLSSQRYQQQIASRRALARNLVQESGATPSPTWFKSIQEIIQGVGNTILLVVMLLLAYALLPVSILGLAVAEISRVAAGVRLFDAPRATLMAVVVVSTYLVLLVVNANMNHHSAEMARPVWSFRLFWGHVKYVLGWGRGWKTLHKTRRDLLNLAIIRLGNLIILLGTAGSLQNELRTLDGAWYLALWHIVALSDLITFLALLGGISLTAGLLAGLHFCVTLAYDNWIKLVPDSHADFLADSSALLRAEEAAEREYLLSLLSKFPPLS